MFTMPETAFLRAQIAPKSLSAGASPQTPLGELTALPRPPSWIQGALLLRLLLLRGRKRRGGSRKIVHPEKFLRIDPGLDFLHFRKGNCRIFLAVMCKHVVIHRNRKYMYNASKRRLRRIELMGL